MSQFQISIVRTVVPALVGTLVALGLRAGIDIPETALTAVLEPLVIGAVYAVSRLLEEKVSPSFGWLLGVPAKPQYNA